MITFTEFCDSQLMPPIARKLFQSWLGDEADKEHTLEQWQRLFAAWIVSRYDDEPPIPKVGSRG